MPCRYLRPPTDCWPPRSRCRHSSRSTPQTPPAQTTPLQRPAQPQPRARVSWIPSVWPCSIRIRPPTRPPLHSRQTYVCCSSPLQPQKMPVNFVFFCNVRPVMQKSATRNQVGLLLRGVLPRTSKPFYRVTNLSIDPSRLNRNVLN